MLLACHSTSKQVCEQLVGTSKYAGKLLLSILQASEYVVVLQASGKSLVGISASRWISNLWEDL